MGKIRMYPSLSGLFGLKAGLPGLGPGRAGRGPGGPGRAPGTTRWPTDDMIIHHYALDCFRNDLLKKAKIIHIFIRQFLVCTSYIISTKLYLCQFKKRLTIVSCYLIPGLLFLGAASWSILTSSCSWAAVSSSFVAVGPPLAAVVCSCCFSLAASFS